MDSRGDDNSTEAKWDEESSRSTQLEAQDLIKRIRENNVEGIMCLATMCVIAASAIVTLFR